jgi:hypothetical protein
MKKPSCLWRDGFLQFVKPGKSGCKLDHEGRRECSKGPVFNDTGFGFLSDLDFAF